MVRGPGPGSDSDFATRLHPDWPPGFPLAAAWVATGKHVGGQVVRAGPPVTELVAYMIVPFAKSEEPARR